MSKIAKVALAVCLTAELLGNSFAKVYTAKEWEEVSRNAYTVQISGGVFTGEENKTVIGDVFTGVGMGALMLVKTPMIVLRKLGIFMYSYEYDPVYDSLVAYEKKVRNQYSPGFQTKRYEHEHTY